MKTVFKYLAPLLALGGAVMAQGKPEVGFIRIVNAVSPGTGNASFLVDGRDLYPKGYALGQTTGGYGIRAGTTEIEIRKQGVESGSTRVKLEIGETMTIIAFAERSPAKEPDEPPKWQIKLLRLKQQEVERGFGLSLVSVCEPDETAVDLNITGKNKTERAFAKKLRITKVDLGRTRGEIMVGMGGRTLTVVSPDSPGNYVVILYENPGGTIEALSYYDPKFVIAG